MTNPIETGRGPAVEMPKPTAWPLVLALSLALAGAGVALGTVAFLAVGGLLFVVALWNWMAALLPGRGREAVPLTHPTPAAVVGRPGTVEQLRPGMEGYRFRLPEKTHAISTGLKAGVAGGLVMLLPALAWGVLSGRGVWFAVYLRAGVALPGVEELSMAELEQFRPTLLVVGLMIHVVMSLAIGLVYGVLLPTVPKHPGWQLLVGGVVLPLIWTGATGGMIGVMNPLLGRYVNWYWYTAAHLMFGLGAVAVILRAEKLVVPPAGSGVGRGEGETRRRGDGT